MTASITRDHERVRRVVAVANHRCWSWAEKCSAPGDGHDGNPPCLRIIAAGETYVESTIYPGHDSGYADSRVVMTPHGWASEKPRPITSKFCLPCAGRWTNLKSRLAELDAQESQ